MKFTIQSTLGTNLMAAVFVILADALFLCRMKRREKFVLRAAASLAVYFGICLFFADVYPQKLGAINLKYTCFLLASIPLSNFCFEINWNTSLFCCTGGYAVQHITTASLFLLQKLHIVPYAFWTNFAVGLPFYLLFYLLIRKRIRLRQDVAIKSIPLLLLVTFVLISDILLNTLLIEKMMTGYVQQYDTIASVAIIMCCFCTIIILFDQMIRTDLEHELTIISNMWHAEQKQYQLSKETIDAINRKCHDLRHQIRVLGRQQQVEPAVLADIADSIRVYDSMVKTGCEALDIILAEKSLYCLSHNISINYIADGAKLSFMQDSDIYSLFGNLLDNAIAAVMTLENDQRFIGLTIRAEGALLSINSNNYFTGDIRIVNGYPQTRTGDTFSHGYGIRSMEMLVHKYDGSFVFDAKDNIFNINVLIPIKAAAKADAAP